MSETIFVTGAGGFLGGTIVEALYFGEQYQVRAGLSRWLSAPRVARLGVPLIQCDIMRPTELAKAFQGVDYVIHCAVGDHAVTVDGTRNVLTAARAAGVKRVVHISTVSIYGDATGLVDETTRAPDGTLTDYGEAKLQAERVCVQFDATLPIVRLRPTIIYGPFAGRWTMLYAQRLHAGWPHLGDAGTGQCNLVHAHDVARFAIAAVEPGRDGQAFNINGPDVVTWNDYLERFARAMGVRPPRPNHRLSGVKSLASNVVRRVGKYAATHHKAQLRWIAHRSDRLKGMMEHTETAMRLTVNPQELALYRLDATYLTAKADQTFGFGARIGLDQGLAMTAAWLDHMGESA
jgi:nucleoside-diphosphate-sugar epimerase